MYMKYSFRTDTTADTTTTTLPRQVSALPPVIEVNGSQRPRRGDSALREAATAANQKEYGY